MKPNKFLVITIATTASFILLLLFLHNLTLPFTLKGAHNDTGTDFSPPLPDNKVTQTFTASHNNLSRINIMLAGNKVATGTATLNLYHSKENQPIATTSSAIANLTSKYFHSFFLDPITNSQGQNYRFSLAFQPDTDSSQLIINQSNYNAFQEGQELINNQPVGSDIVFRTYYQTDKSFITLAISALIEKITQDKLFFTFYFALIVILLRIIIDNRPKDL